jgi:hypothetical protein
MQMVASQFTAASIPGRGVGIVIAVSCAVAGLLLAFLGRTRLPAAVVVPLLAACGAGFAIAGTLFDPFEWQFNRGEIVAAVVLLAVLTPLHVRVVLGPFGRRA